MPLVVHDSSKYFIGFLARGQTLAQSWRLKALNLGSTANTMFPKPGGEVSVKSSFMDDRASMTPPDPAGRNLSTSLVLEDTLGGMGAVPARGRADHGSGSTELSRQRRTLSRPRTKLPELSGLLLARECNSDWTECSRSACQPPIKIPPCAVPGARCGTRPSV